MIDSNYLVFIHPNIVPYLNALGIFDITKAQEYDYVACSKVRPSTIPGFVDLTIPKIQEDQEIEFVASIPNQYLVYMCWADNQSLYKIHGFRGIPKDADNHQP